MPLDSRLKKKKKEMYVCCLHDDTDPSLGIIHSKDGEEIYHCFGCNSWGNIIKLHKRVELKYHNRYINEDRAVQELCELFGVDYNSLPKENVEDITDKDIRRQIAMAEAMNRFDISHFQHGLVRGKLEGKGIPYFNTLMVRMIDEVKR